MSQFFNTYLYGPILSLLVFIYQNFAFRDLGLAIILLTVLVRIALFPLFYKSVKSQVLIARLQPDVKRIQETYKKDKEKQARELIKLYRDHHLNPFSGFLVLVVQLPIIFALYRVFLNGLSDTAFDNHLFFGLIDLSTANFFIIVGAAALQYVQGRVSLQISPDGGGKGGGVSLGRTMVVIGPALTFIILSQLPSAIGVYWATTTIFTIAQQWYVNKKVKIQK